MNSNDTITSSIDFPKRLNDLSGYSFRIPIYQRKYAWRETDIQQLLKDLNEAKESHFIGNIVVEESAPGVYDVIDGQQRLTTLYLIGMARGHEGLFKLSYEVRDVDNAFLKQLKLKENIDENIVDELITNFQQNDRPDEQLITNVKTILNEIDKVENIRKAEFAFTILASNEVDIAKYFEVMNSRGKQLEQHQVLKAKFLQCIKKEDHAVYAKLWDYCSRMDVYIEDFVYQYEKRKYNRATKQSKYDITKEDLRWSLLQFASDKSGTGVETYFDKTRCKESGSFITILEALEEGIQENEEMIFEGVDRYRSFMKFEYFLLHVLRFYLEEKNAVIEHQLEIKDTKLIEQYEKTLPFLAINEIDVDIADTKSKSFLHTLFRCRILYDYFFFKRFNADDEPFVPKLNGAGNGIGIDRYSRDKQIRQILNLQLLFNFTGDFHAQHWMQSVLRLVSNNRQYIVAQNFQELYDEFVSFMEHFDQDIMYVRLANGDLQKHYLQYSDDGNKTSSNMVANSLKEHLHKGTSTQHYWFYRLDYLLWRDIDWTINKATYPFATNENFDYKTIPDKFRLSRLNSVEHIKPQDSKEDWENGNVECGNCPNRGVDRIDCFGNLALISQHMNSALSDDNKENKKLLIQRQLNRGTIESLKMLIFYSDIPPEQDIDIEYCKNHQKEMINFLCESFQNESEQEQCKD